MRCRNAPGSALCRGQADPGRAACHHRDAVVKISMLLFLPVGRTTELAARWGPGGRYGGGTAQRRRGERRAAWNRGGAPGPPVFAARGALAPVSLGPGPR